MLYRMQLSKSRPEWIDENGEPFIYYSLKEVMRDISCGEKKALQLFKELEEAHLIRRRSQCQFSTPRIYIPTNHPDEAWRSFRVIPFLSFSGWHFQICPAQPMYLWLSILIMYLWLEYLWLGFDLEGRRVWFGRTISSIWKDGGFDLEGREFDLEGREATWVNPSQKKRSWPS